MKRGKPVTIPYPSHPSVMAFDANGDLYVGGYLTDIGSSSGDGIIKITDLDGTPTVSAWNWNFWGNV